MELLEENLNILKSKVKTNMNINVVQGNALDLSMYKDNTFDITLLLGPLYHLFNEDEKKKSIEEAIRVTKNNGKIFVAFITNETAILSYCLRKGNMLKLKEICDENYKVKEPIDKVFSVNYTWDIKNMISLFNVTLLKEIATDGISPQLALYINQLSDEEFKIWLDYHYATCERQDLLSYSSHILYICEKDNFIDLLNEQKSDKDFSYAELHKRWIKKYFNYSFINLKEELNTNNIKLLKKLGIEIQDKLYTEYEYDLIVDQELLAFYIDDTMKEEELRLSKPLPKNVTREDYNKILDKFEFISKKYNV